MSSPSPPLHSWLVFVYLIEAGAGAVVQARMYMKGIKFIRKGDYWFAVCISYKFSLENYGKFVLEWLKIWENSKIEFVLEMQLRHLVAG